MKTRVLLIVTTCLCLISAALSTGCVSVGKDFDEANVSRIQKGVTTESDLVSWFGKPSNRVTTSDGKVALMWAHYTSQGFVSTHSTSKTLTVTLGPDGKVQDYSLSGGEM